MPSLLDFLNQGQSGNGLLGALGGGSFYNEPQEADAARQAAAAQLASIMGKRQPAPVTPMDATAVGQDPFNFVMPGAQGAPTTQAAPAPLPPAIPVGPPPGAMPASLPVQAPVAAPPAAIPTAPPTAPAAARPSFFGGLNNYIDNNRATLMALAGGIANQGMGGFATAAPIAMQERQYQQTQQNQMLAANAIQQGLLSKGHDPREATAIALASAGNPAIASAVLPELFSNKPSGTMFGIPYSMANGQIKFLMPQGTPGGGGEKSLMDMIKFGQGVEAQGAAAKTAAETTAKAQAEAAQSLPDALANADQTLKEIRELQTHGGKSLATGPVLGRAPAFGGAQADYIGRLEQLKGAATALAIASNKAGIRLTDREVRTLQASQGRLDRTGDIDAGLRDFESVVKGIRERAGPKAGQGPTPAPAPVSPASGGWSVTRIN